MTPIMLQDWRCDGPYENRTCGRLLIAYDPKQTSLETLKASQQVKCFRCGHLNGISGHDGRRNRPGR